MHHLVPLHLLYKSPLFFYFNVHFNSAKSKGYYGITRSMCGIFVKTCDFCMRVSKTPPSFSRRKTEFCKPIITSQFLHRCQVDLIDMGSVAFDGKRFLMRYVDLATAFQQMRPLSGKSAKEVVIHLFQIWCAFGAPSILQSDNGTEFLGEVIRLCSLWMGNQD